jgi:hypothetical protein
MLLLGSRRIMEQTLFDEVNPLRSVNCGAALSCDCEADAICERCHNVFTRR